MTDIHAFIDALPKVELHVHLVGSASVATVLELARRHTGHRIPLTEAALAEFYEFRDFPHFAEVYDAVNDVIRDPADVATLVTGAARDLAAQNARYVELTVTPYAHTARGMPATAVTEALNVASREAAERYGIDVAYIFDISGEGGPEAAATTLDHALDHPPQRLVGFGLGGVEASRAGYRDVLRDTFRAATAAGLHSVPHAGEMTGPEEIWEAINGLGAERIGHGIGCLADPELVTYLRETQIPLEVCPTSNVRTRQVAHLADHPLPRLLAEGLFVTLNSDDPPMFGTTLTGEYRAATTLGLGPADLAGLARNAVRASFLDTPAKLALLSEIDAIRAPGSRTPE